MNILHYKRGKPPTYACFGHLMWPPQGGVIQRIYNKHKKTNAQI